MASLIQKDMPDFAIRAATGGSTGKSKWRNERSARTPTPPILFWLTDCSPGLPPWRGRESVPSP